MMPWFMWSRVSSSSRGLLPCARLAGVQLALRLLEPALMAQADRDPDQDEKRQSRSDRAVDVPVAPIVAEHVMLGLPDRDDQRIAVQRAIGSDARDAVEASACGELPLRLDACTLQQLGFRIERADGVDLEPGAGAHHAVEPDQQHGAVRSEIDRFIERGQFLRAERHHEDTTEIAEMVAIGARQLHRPLARGAAEHRPADEQLVAGAVLMRGEMLAVRDVHRRGERAGAGRDQIAGGVGHAELHHHAAELVDVAGPVLEFYEQRLLRRRLLQRTRHAVAGPDGSEDLVFEHAREIVRGALRRGLGPRPLAPQVELDGAPEQRDQGESEDDRGMPGGPQPVPPIEWKKSQGCTPVRVHLHHRAIAYFL